MDSDDVVEVVRDVGDSPIVENGARLGYAVNGLLHLLLGSIALRLAMGTRSQTADQSGALSTLAGSTLGWVALVVAVIGYALLAVWQLTELVLRHDLGHRVKSLGKAIVYAAIGFSALAILRGSRSSSSAQSVDFTASVMDKPAGRLLVGAIGLGILGIAGYHVYKGWTKRFLSDLDEHPGDWAVHAGRAGYVTKGIALALVALLFLGAALHQNPNEARGLDGALLALLGAPFGRVALALVALGLGAYGVYSFARARHARV